MKRQRAFSATELLVAASLLTFGVVTACGGDDSASSGHGGGGGISGGGAGGSSAVGGKGGKSGSGGKGGKGGKSGSAGDDGTAGADVPDSGPVTGSAAGAGGEAGAVNTELKQNLYPAVKFPTENQDSAAKDMLGKILFWDEQVGSDNTMACGTCHRTGPGGGSDPRAVSPNSRHPGDDGLFGTADDIHGSQGIKYCTGGDLDPVVYTAPPAGNPFGMNHQVTGRKAPTYLDAMFAANIFWDGRATTQFLDPVTNLVTIAVGGALESQSVGPPMNSGEMACASRDWGKLGAKLKTVKPLDLATNIPTDMKDAITAAHGSYPELFNAAFGSAEITGAHFAFAIATHERHLTSNQTPWDRYNQYLNDPKTGDRHALTPAQVRGFGLFMGKAKCNACHLAPFFSDFQFHNLHFITEKDLGRQAVAGHSSEPVSQVKTANLRNVGLRESQGLFHYGFGPGANLDTVIASYNTPPHPIDATAIQQDPTLGSIQALNLVDDEIADLTDFLRNGLTDPRVANQEFPFDKPTLKTEQ